jgi:predicted phage-related endonuclease
MLTKEDKLRKVNKVGSSSIATILGWNEYETPFEYVQRWRGNIGEKVATPPMIAGNVFEASIAGFYMKLTGKVIIPASGTTYEHPDYSWKISHPDFLDEFGNPVEIKNVGKYSEHKWGPDGSDDIPLGPLCQVVDQCILLKRNTATVVAYFGGADLRVYKIDIPEQIKENQLAKVVSFYYKYLETDNGEYPPASGRDTSILNEVYEGSKDADITANDEIDRVVNRYIYTKQLIDQNKAELDEVQAEIKDYMEEATRLIGRDGNPVLSWKRNKDSEKVDYKALCKHLNPDRTIISKFTETKIGNRSIRLIKSKKKEVTKDD